ncbi:MULTISPECIES: hypothetical protein [unclassified Mesorhizobium]|uniref:hypothetical protein n=1 Tax=unclassified Mesorhizobium TaxID=325217 RepID=UPI001093AABC|nr:MULTISPECIES: hypothetical protein [unclassified Mesorhizobium]TGT90882.1 hypothetical protein EN804_05975 [Mesorhizobium sp. M8A.F.Ca.ET.161.01.1.1]TGV43838.1 hypothetical protein EN785_07570 [Mesorhizobium sp. M8A.F.Ca.ET.142.01.1.1]
MNNRELPGSFDDVIRLVMIEINKAVAEGTSIESAVRTALFPVLVGPVPEKKSTPHLTDEQIEAVRNRVRKSDDRRPIADRRFFPKTATERAVLEGDGWSTREDGSMFEPQTAGRKLKR